MEITQAVVISLLGSQRFVGFEAADWGGLSFARFEAVDTRDGTVPAGFSVDDFRLRYGVSPRPGEMGCAMSHATVIGQFAQEEGDPEDLLLVAEDDARPVPELLQVLRRVIRVMERRNVDIALLSEPIFGTRRSLKTYALSLLAHSVGHGRRFGHCADKIAGTGLYLITRRACRSYTRVAHGSGVSWVADDYGFGSSDVVLENPFHGLDVRVVRPGLCDWEGETTIQDPEGYAKFSESKLSEYELQGGGGVLRRGISVFSRLRRHAFSYASLLLRVTLSDIKQRFRERKRR